MGYLQLMLLWGLYKGSLGAANMGSQGTAGPLFKPKPNKPIVPPTKPLSQQSSKTCPVNNKVADSQRAEGRSQLEPNTNKPIVPPTKPSSQQSSKTCPVNKAADSQGTADRSDSAKKAEGINNELQQLKNRLSTFQFQMESKKTTSRFANFSQFWSKNNQQAIIRKQALESAKEYADKYLKNSKDRIEFWKEMTKEPIFYLQRRASLFHSRDGFTTTVKKIVEDEITPHEKDFKPDEGTRYCNKVLWG